MVKQDTTFQKVYIVNRGKHDYSKAKRWGRLVTLTRGRLEPTDSMRIYSQINSMLKASTVDDYLLMSGLVLANMIAAAIFVKKHGRLNLLIYKDGDYIERSIIVY